MKHRNDFREGVDGQPQPQHLFGTAQPSAQFIRLEIRQMQMAEEALVQGKRVLARAWQPGGDGRLPVAEDPFSSRRVQPFGQRREHHDDLPGRGFQAVQGGVTSRAECAAARLTTERLDLLGMAVLAISDQGVDSIIGDAEVRALGVQTGMALRIHASGAPIRYGG
jgi:hypothetical protein